MYRILASDGLQEKAINNLIELGLKLKISTMIKR